jgi:hypothetical protein
LRVADELHAALPVFAGLVPLGEAEDILHIKNFFTAPASSFSAYKRATGMVESGRRTTRSPVHPSQSRKE